MLTAIKAPTTCPSCSSVLEWVNDQLFCRNNMCPAQSTKKLQHFCSKLKIKGFGEKTLEKLELTNLLDLLSYNYDYGISCGLGDKTALNLENEVSRIKSRGIITNDFIAAQSIPLVGDGVSRKITSESIEDITFESLKDNGVGEKAATNLINWLNNDWLYLKDDYLPILVTNPKVPNNNDIKGDVCITGKLNDYKSRALATKHLESLGWNVKKSVTKTVKYLISEDGNTTNSSYKKAIENNIEIVSIKDLEDK